MKTGIDTIWEDRKRILGMPISFTKYYLSEDRLFVQTGLLSMKIEETLLYRVTDISARVGLFQRIFGVGTIVIHSSDKSTPHIALVNVKEPLVVKELIHKHVEADEGLAQHPRQRISRRRPLRTRPVRPYGA